MIRIPFEYVEDNGRVALLLTPEARATLERSLAESREAGVSESALSAVSHRLDTDRRLHEQPNCVRRVAVFREPTWQDKADIEAAASVYRPELRNLVVIRPKEWALRVEKLLVRVEDAGGGTVGGMEAIPTQIVETLGAELQDHFEPSADLMDFLRPSENAPDTGKASRSATRR